MTSSRRYGTPPAAPGTADALVVGVLVGPHGLRGEVKLVPLTEFPQRIPRLERLLLRSPGGRCEWRRLLGCRPHRKVLLLQLEGVVTRDAADALREAEVLIDRRQAPALPEGRYYEDQILGLRVITPEGEELGVVSRILRGVSNDVYMAGRYLVPATHDAVIRLAPEEGIIVVRSKEYLEGEEVR